MYTVKNVKKPTAVASGAVAPKDPNVVIVPVDDILSWPQRDGNSVNMIGSFVMKPNTKMFTVYMSPTKIKTGFESSGDEDVISFKHKFEGEHPGNELEIAEFIQNFTNVKCVVIYSSECDTYKKVVGTKCAPLHLKPSLKDEATRISHLVFEQASQVGYVLGHYTGSLTFADAPVLAATPAMSIIAANTPTVQLAENNTAVVNIGFGTVELDADQTLTLIGGGGSFVSTLTSGIGVNTSVYIVLKTADWTAAKNATITLKKLTGQGKTYFIEQYRS